MENWYPGIKRIKNTDRRWDRAKDDIRDWETEHEYANLVEVTENVGEDNDVEELRQSHSEFVVNGHIDKNLILDHYDKKCEKMKEMQENLKALSADHEENWENIISVVDDSLPQIKLNFNQFP